MRPCRGFFVKDYVIDSRNDLLRVWLCLNISSKGE